MERDNLGCEQLTGRLPMARMSLHLSCKFRVFKQRRIETDWSGLRSECTADQGFTRATYFDGNIFRRWRASSAASANSQSRNLVIFGTLETASGQTIR